MGSACAVVYGKEYLQYSVKIAKKMKSYAVLATLSSFS